MPSPVRGSPSEAQTLESLEAITRQSNDVPALLLITPPTTSPSLLPDAEERKPVRRLRISRPASRSAADAAVDRSQLKELQDSVNEMSAALARQKTAFDNERAALKKALAESQSKSAGLEQQISSLANAKSGATANDDIRKQLLDKSKQVTQLQQQLESAGAKERQESQRLSLALAESRMSVSALQARLDAISIVQDKDRSQMQAESQKRFDELQKQLTVLNADKTQRERDGKKLQQALAESQKKADDLQKQLTALNADKTQREQDGKKLQQALAESQKKADDLQKQLTALNAGKTQREQDGKKLQQALAESQKKADELQKQLTVLNAGKTQREQDGKKLQQALAESQKKADDLQKQLTALNAGKTQREQDGKKLQQALAESQKKADELQKQLTVLNAGKTQREQDGKKLQQALAESQKKADDLQQQLTVLTADKTQREQDGKKLQQALAESQKKADELQKQVAALTGGKAQQEQDGKKLQQALAENQKKTDELTRQIATLTADKTGQEQIALKLQQTLAESEKKSGEQARQIAALTAEQTEKQKQAEALVKELTELKARHGEKERDAEDAQNALTESRTKVDALQKQLAALEQKAATLEAGEPKTAEQIRDYAIGTSLGSDMLSMLKERETYGIRIGKNQALNGVADAFTGHLKLPADKIARALYELDVNFNKQEKTLKERMEKQGAQYIAKFSKQPKVKKAPSGFYYRVDYVGQGEIKDTDKVVVVVKESLTDGTVVKDMDVEGTSVSQPLSAYPPLFQAALSQLKNHGSLTMVVPPTLAYGDKGLPPDIPPGATMVYNVRILDILPETAEVGAKR
ncbi:FKBP-type peptidyl-prolyl cis-trans isomerase [Pluralibacter gergoviae]|uniref:peptidylprolyl isomerase n=2 Tax=Pluralibacter gergoviae TaxID=61647 RepID=A0AAI9DLY6_PLUGE|nr:FKBP-type peptidyl-prolyl cis-trans isomerase [Pluralibacter gergoviae]EKV9908050.1 FKBP-type peptidyl-prolyl cis-trans isomerase [Pluralibacter gergoviae]EKW7275639.1 FKBP-type peptidyl-prolyl cis-trans isomerase [Pluralibacter gergoviae]ELD4296795.1 FKBP-type peptidyl-prolyl cis-trans isomerase [Pluralibacter gergoviae]ELD4307444.1 FKBP-type peptidyl-prolyl cis-trans isomerase [Pluralibacter gergoviae]